ncbi:MULTISPECIES: hypothetical protein [unclassified Streptomyces]
MTSRWIFAAVVDPCGLPEPLGRPAADLRRPLAVGPPRREPLAEAKP